MIDFENLIDNIRIELYEETKSMDKIDIINRVNSHAQKIAQELGIRIDNPAEEESYQILDV